jgi:hypothetical protein
MMPALDPNQQRYLADRLTAWARGDAAPDPAGTVAVVLCETDDATDWLRHTGLIGPDSVVLVRGGRRSGPLPTGPGTWLRYRGTLDEPGDEIEIEGAFWVQTTDFASLRYLSVSGPTVVRLTGAEDVAALGAEVAQAVATGTVCEPVLHPGVEVGDRCALAGAVPCTGHGLPARLYVGADGTVRSAPRGLGFGRVGDPAAGLADAARQLARDADVCLEPAVAGALHRADRAALAGYLAAVDALRILSARIRVPWRVSGLGFRYAAEAMGDAPVPPRGDLLLLAAPDEQVLFDTRVRRAFKINPGMAEVLDVLLHTPDEGLAFRRLAACRHVPGDPVLAAANVRAELARRGVALPTAVLAGRP